MLIRPLPGIHFFDNRCGAAICALSAGLTNRLGAQGRPVLFINRRPQAVPRLYLRPDLLRCKPLVEINKIIDAEGFKPRNPGKARFHLSATTSITSISGRDAQAVFRRRRHQPRRPPLAKIRPGRPAPAMGPGTGDATRPEVLKAQVLRASNCARSWQSRLSGNKGYWAASSSCGVS